MRKFFESTCCVFLLLFAWTNVLAGAVTAEGSSPVACQKWALTEHSMNHAEDRERSATPDTENHCQSSAESCCEVLCAESSAPLALCALELGEFRLYGGSLQQFEPLAHVSPVYPLDKPPQ